MLRTVQPFNLVDFISESNRIEGIAREPLHIEIVAHQRFLSITPTVDGLSSLVSVLQPDAIIRDESGLDVIVGRYRPPPGGPHIRQQLEILLRRLDHPYGVHQAYEALHPFTDGNGRSGRALWLYMMGGIERAPLGFLHHWYYQSLQNHCGISEFR